MKKISCTISGYLRAVAGVALGVLLTTGMISAQGSATVTITPNTPIGPNPGEIQETLTLAGIPAFAPVEAVSLELAIDHTWSSDLEITLQSPLGDQTDITSDNGGSCDWDQTIPITFVDTSANGTLACLSFPDVCPSACDFNFEGGSIPAPLNSADWNSDWVLIINDDAFGDGGVLAEATLTVVYGALADTTCELTCPSDEFISLQPGECFAPYNFELTLDGGLPGCVLNPDPLPGFQGAFDFAATDFCQNCPSNSMGFATTTCWIIESVDVFEFGTSDFFACNCCPFFGTIQQWVAPEDITITFDWEYTTADATPAADPFGYSVGADWNGIVGTIANLNANTIPLTDPAGPVNQSGSASIDVAAGEPFAFIAYDALASGAAPATVTITNFESGLTPPAATATQLAGPPSGSLLPPGETDFEFQVELLTGDILTCGWTVTVVEFTGGTSVLACNDNVQVSVDENCEAIVTTDMILEGGPYNCYDGYLVSIEGYGANLGGMMIDEDAIGETLEVTITDTLTGNSCWGTISVEDKLPPMLTNCEPITLPCGIDTDPQFTPPLTDFISIDDSPALGIDMPPGENVDFSYAIPVAAPLGFAVTDVDVTLQITHTWSADLEVSITAPNGVTVPLATAQCGGADNWDVTFDDDGMALMCGTDPAIGGTVRPEQPLANLNGAVASGIWTINVVDNFPVLDDGSLDFVQLDIELEELQATAPSVIENCGDFDLTFEDEEVGDECTGFAIERTWTATDDSGNSSTCVQLISITPLDLSALECPDNFEGECDEFPNGEIDPDITGYPSVGGVEITDGSICNIVVDFWDKELPACGNGTKIIRTWTILDWCTQEVVECVQVIKLDGAGPQLICPNDQVVGADPWNCDAHVNLIEPIVIEVCGETDFTLTPTSSNGTIVNFGSFFRVDGLPLGETVITWTAADDCGNESTCTYVINVIDDVPPIPLCDEHTIVALSTDGDLQQGLTKIPAEVFDDGSYDNCSDVTFTARRMTSCIDFDWTTGGACVDEIKNGLVTSPDRGTAFRPCVPFACCDVAAGPIMVELRVEDEAGNINSCMVEVEVQDKLSPFVVCPPSVEVSCDFWFAANETNGFVPQDEDVLSPVFGRVLDAFDFDESDRQDIIIDDPGNDNLPQPFNWGKDGWADDNCDVEITVRVRIFDDCSGDDLPGIPPANAVRLVERTFLARDAQGNSQTCVQRIWVVDFDPFYISDETCVNADPRDGVIWPCDENYDFCPQDGIPVNPPTIFDDNCSLIGVTFEDTRFDFVDDACYKILREWTVIDWCQHDVQTGAGLWSYIQVIKVIDDEPTFILGCPNEIDPITRSVLDPGVTLPDNNQVFLGETNPLATRCSVHYTDTFGLEEFCSGEVTYDVKVYPFNGSDFLQIHEKRTVQIDTNGFGEAIIDTRTSDILGVRLNGLPYNDRFCLPNGEKDVHRVLITVEDGCGNINTCEYLLRLEDRKAPTPVCVGLSSVVMPSSGEVTIWARDFEASSFDDCTLNEDLLFSFSGTSFEPSRSFDCEALEENGSPSFVIEIWVADEGNDMDCSGGTNPISWAERNKDFCSTFIVINDNEGVCGNSGSAGGVIQTEELEPVELVTVELSDDNGNVVFDYTTDKDGAFIFQALGQILGLEAEPARDDDHDNGVSTLDLVKIQKHLLGIEDLGSPYKLIAADANNSESVSAIDLVELRKLILGLYTELPNNESWRFVDGTFTFADPDNPWPFAEVSAMEAGMDNDFMAVKVGDVNGTVAANVNSIETRNVVGALNFEIADKQVEAGEEVVVDVTSSNFNNILGYQFTLGTAGLKLTDVTAGAIDMGIENVATHKTSVTASWHRVDPVALGSNDVLFTMTFQATQAGKLSEMLDINSRLTDAEAYNGAEEILDVAMNFGNETVASGNDFELFQNNPNPFNAETVVGFNLPKAMSATITVFDVTGKVVFTQDGDYVAGYNMVTLNSDNLKATGVLYYRLDADDFTATKKMVLID